MAVPKKHGTKSKARKRRSHQALKPISLSVCPECKHPKEPHRACANCGYHHRSSKKVEK